MAKYNVDDWVEVKVPPTGKTELWLIAHILEVTSQAQICESGCEHITYVVRLWDCTEDKRACASPMRLREMELGNIVNLK